MHLVIYGDFNCPYSYLASTRAEALRDRTAVEWRAVEHDPSIPRPSRRVIGQVASMFEREIDDIRSLLRPAEQLPITVPHVQSNTATAIEAFGATPVRARAELRRRMFAAYWSDAADIGDPTFLSHLARHRDARASTETRLWRLAWTSFARPMVPMLVLPSGDVLPGVHALEWLADAGAH